MAQPADFAGSNANVKPGKGTEDRVGPLPSFYSAGGEVISRWRLSPAEREQVARTGDIWISQMTFRHPLQPVMVSGLPLMQLQNPDGTPSGDVYDPDVPLVGDSAPKPIHVFQDPAEVALDALARTLYIASIDDSAIHSNRFPAYEELSLIDRYTWRIAALKAATLTPAG